MDKNDSVPRKSQQILVAASPLNPVKLELALIILISTAIFFSVERWVGSDLVQIAVLAVTGALAMGWLVFRSRQIVRKVNENRVKIDEVERKD